MLILTGDQHTDHISTGQQLSRHSLPTLLYFLFSPPHIFFNSILCQPANGTLAFAPTAQSQPLGKIQRAVSANTLSELSDNKTDFLRILTNYKF